MGGNGQTSPPTNSASADVPDSVFVVHGRNLAVRDAMFELLRSAKLHPLEWSEAIDHTGVPNPFIGDVLDQAFEHAVAVVVILSADDLARLKPGYILPHDDLHEREETGQPRPNVLFEAGMAMGRNAHRTVLVEVEKVRPFSDIAGRHLLRFDGSTSSRRDLLLRLQAAGCRVDLTGGGWRKAGKFANLTVSIEDLAPELDAVRLRARVSTHMRNRIRIDISNDGHLSIEDLKIEHIDSEKLVLLAHNQATGTLLVPGASAGFSAVTLTEDALEAPIHLQLGGRLPNRQDRFVISIPVGIH